MIEFHLYLILTGFVGLLGGYWVLTDPRSLNERTGDFKDRNTLVRRTLQYSLFCVQAYLSVFLSGSREIGSAAITIIGLMLFALGFILSVWAKTVMRGSWGLPATLNASRQKLLVTSGPFSYTRNPIYVGLLLTGMGYFLTLRSPLIFGMLPVAIYFYWAAVNEEKLLARVFGKKYEQYLLTTPRFLFF